MGPWKHCILQCIPTGHGILRIPDPEMCTYKIFGTLGCGSLGTLGPEIYTCLVGPWEPRILNCVPDVGPWEPWILKCILDVGPWKPRILKCILDMGPWEPRILKCLFDAGPWEPRILKCILDAGP